MSGRWSDEYPCSCRGPRPSPYSQLVDSDDFEKVTLRVFVVVMVLGIAGVLLVAFVSALRTGLAG